MIGLLMSRWFWMVALVVLLFISAAGWAKTWESHRETKAAYKAMIQNFEQTQAAYDQRDIELRTIAAQLTERKRVVYVTKDDCADTRHADGIFIGLRGTSADNP